MIHIQIPKAIFIVMVISTEISGKSETVVESLLASKYDGDDRGSCCRQLLKVYINFIVDNFVTSSFGQFLVKSQFVLFIVCRMKICQHFCSNGVLL